ncbi:MAG: ribosome maturation factor RimP [Selenomonadaceae bacterium]|nr:ribosome maturation factor RimP [Selenomonadaceae bacterium]
MSKIEEKVEQLAEKLIETQKEIELVDVEYVKEHDWYLRIFIDKVGGIGLDDCQKFSEALGKILDAESVIDNPYILEVSSPGLDRPLKKDRDFIRERGKKVDVTFYAPLNGKKMITGVLENYEDKILKLEEYDPIAMDKVAAVRLHIDF